MSVGVSFAGSSPALENDLFQPLWTTAIVDSHHHRPTLLFLDKNNGYVCGEEFLWISFTETSLPFDYCNNGRNWRREQSNHSFTNPNQHCGTRISSTMQHVARNYFPSTNIWSSSWWPTPSKLVEERMPPPIHLSIVPNEDVKGFVWVHDNDHLEDL